MHELGVVFHIIDDLKAVASDNDVSSISKVTIELGEVSGVVEEYLTDCWGECPKNRILRTVDGEPGLNYLCRGLKSYFKHALPEVDKIVAGLKQNGIGPVHKMKGR